MKQKKKASAKTIIIVLSVLLVYAAAVAVGAVIYNDAHGEIRLLGDSSMTLEWGSEYVECGAVAYTTGKLFGGEELPVEVHTPAGMTEPGSYTVEYTAEYKGETLSCSRSVTVRDTCSPEILLVPTDVYNATLEGGYQEPGFSARDNRDGDITGLVQVSVGTDTVTYTVSDSSGNTVSVRRDIIVAPEKLTITLTGSANMEIEACLTWEDPGFTARDSSNHDASELVQVTLVSVDGEKLPEGSTRQFTPYLPGVYELKYSAEVIKEASSADVLSADAGSGAEVSAAAAPDTGDTAAASDPAAGTDEAAAAASSAEKTDENLTTPVYRTVTVKAKELPKSESPAVRTIYLTFDDGPGPYTEALLNVLKYYGVKATFFVTNQFPDYADMITREYNEGHTVAIHTYQHDYSYIYSGVEQYYADFMKMSDLIYEKTGNRTNLFRFPGGSSNTLSNFNPGIMTTLSKAMPAMGYKEFDWNVTSGDAGGTTRTAVVVSNVKSGVQDAMNTYGYAVVLQHDIKDFSVDAVEEIIQWGLAQGYTFSAIDITSPRAWHPVAN